MKAQAIAANNAVSTATSMLQNFSSLSSAAKLNATMGVLESVDILAFLITRGLSGDPDDSNIAGSGTASGDGAPTRESDGGNPAAADIVDGILAEARAV